TRSVPATLQRHPGFWAVTVYCALHAAILVRLGMAASYVSDRHVMILVLLGSFFAVFGLRELPRRVLRREDADARACASGSGWYRSANLWFVLLFVALVAVCLPKATQRLHGNRVGNRAAGAWLAQHLRLG